MEETFEDSSEDSWYLDLSTGQFAAAPDALAALWIIRLALGYPQAIGLMSRAGHADSLVQLIGAHVDWTPHALESICKRLPALKRNAPLDPIKLALNGCLAWGDVGRAFAAAFRGENAEFLHCLKLAEEALSKRSPEGALRIASRNVGLLADMLSLDQTEQALLLYGVAINQTESLCKLLRKFESVSTHEASRLLSIMLALPVEDVVRALRPAGMLAQTGMLRVHAKPCAMEDKVDCSPSLVDILTCEYADLDALMLRFLEPSPAAGLDAADFPHLAAELRDAQRYLQGALRERVAGVNILLYGPPGTGKTEFARLLARAAGGNCFEVAASDPAGEAADGKQRYASFLLAQQFLSASSDSVIVFDEIEDVFPDNGDGLTRRLIGAAPGKSAAATSKGWVTDLLETNKVPAIWISNAIEQIDPAYLRRYGYHVEFRTPPKAVRRRIAQRHLGALALPADVVESVAEFASVSPAQIATAARTVGLSHSPGNPESGDMLLRVLRHGMAAMGAEEGTPARDNPTGYGLQYLNIDADIPIERMIQALQRAPRSALCFYGVPGTGKTSLAEHIAETLNRPLIARRMSELQSKWVGETEKNIAGMFREATEEGAVLLLDEADSLLRSRTQARASWEVTQVNELLQRMEGFAGLFICATNLFEDIDPAALRRFCFKLRFDYLTSAQRLALFAQETGTAEVDDEAIRRRLAALDTLALGDFATVRRQERFLGERFTPQQFVARLEEECRVKRSALARPIGFTV